MKSASARERVEVWGVRFAPMRLSEVVSAVTELIGSGGPCYFITANTHYAMLTEKTPDLVAINEGAAFIVADGKPLVWASRLRGEALPERVTGSDLIFHLCEESARRGHRVFLLGGAEEVAEEAGRRLSERYPGLQIVGTLSPPFRALTAEDDQAIVAAVRAAQPDLLIGAFTMPKGERWLSANLRALEVPVVVNVGAAIDFAAGRIRRAPAWIQKAGLEWAFRLALEPRRLAGRYARNAWFIGRMIVRDLRRVPARPGPVTPEIPSSDSAESSRPP